MRTMGAIYRGVVITGMLLLAVFFTGTPCRAVPRHSMVQVRRIRYLTRDGWEFVPVSKEVDLHLQKHALLEVILAPRVEIPPSAQFQYKLEGHDSYWHLLEEAHPVYFSGFRNRTYHLLVRMVGEGGESPPTELLTIRVHIPFYSTHAAQILLVVLFLLLTYLYLRYRTRSLRRTNQILMEKERIAREVEKQRDQLSAMHKDLTDSIRYARKIQQALLPSDYYFHSQLPESFILYMPRDIVSGDFYWLNKKDDRIFFAVADCTGHGVPGAFMSMIGFEILDKIINDQGVIHPGEILNILNYGISNTFSRGEEDLLLKDGMDISFCTLDRKNKVLEFAGAFHTLYLIRGNKILEYKGDRVSVGLGEEESGEQFTNHIIYLEEEDKIYLFTDGYVDQFGGPNGKKYMYRRFRHLLLSVHELPMSQQKQILYESFQYWQGDYKQVDDVLILGLDPLKKGNLII